MDQNSEEWLIVALYCDTTPEFRAARNALSEAYSGPEQRRVQPHRLSRNGERATCAADFKRPAAALAA